MSRRAKKIFTTDISKFWMAYYFSIYVSIYVFMGKKAKEFILYRKLKIIKITIKTFESQTRNENIENRVFSTLGKSIFFDGFNLTMIFFFFLISFCMRICTMHARTFLKLNKNIPKYW